MILEENQAKERIKNPLNLQSIQEAINYEKRLNLHTDKVVQENKLSSYWYDYKKWVKSLLPKNKYERFIQLIRLPFSNVEFTDGIFSEFEKVFDTNNPYREDVFSDNDHEAFFKQWFDAEYGTYFKDNALDILKTNPCTVMYVDSYKEDNRTYGNCLFINMVDVIDIVNNKDNECEYFIFRVCNYLYEGKTYDKVAVQVDDKYYRVFDISDSEPLLILENEHNYNETPARSFWTTNLSRNDYIVKDNPIAGSLGNLDYLLLKTVGKDYANLYASYPIVVHTEIKCDYVDYANNMRCEDGYLRSSGGVNFNNSDDYNTPNVPLQDLNKPCPKCAGKRALGAGSEVTVPAPEEGYPEIKEPVKFVPTPTDSLEFIQTDLAKYKEMIWLNSVGKATDLLGSEAMNEKQVNAAFESKKTALLNITNNLSQAEQWKRKMLGKTMFPNTFKESIVDYGDEFFLKSIEELQEEKKAAKENGASQAELMAIQQQIINTKFKNNPKIKSKMDLLLNLEPFPTSSEKEVREMYKEGLVLREHIIKKTNFQHYIDRFEREKGDLLEFGSEQDFNNQVNLINQIIDEYVISDIKREEDQRKRRQESEDLGEGQGALPLQN